MDSKLSRLCLGRPGGSKAFRLCLGRAGSSKTSHLCLGRAGGSKASKRDFFTWALIICTTDRNVSLAPRLSFHSDRSTESLGAKVGQHKFGVTNPLLVGSTFCNQIVCIGKQAMWKVPMVIHSRQDGLFPRFDWLVISYFWWFDWSVRIPCICCRQDGAVYNPPEWC